ncbi:hypothetical protein CY652_09980 [Burkholderia sp. WAC0059]|nr:hypothetical protein CY652_09980 [Burkholderia sp. WAC0059]
MVTRNAQHFPALGRRYLEQTASPHNARFAGSLKRWAKQEKWAMRDGHDAARSFAGLLKAALHDEGLPELRQPSEADITTQAPHASLAMLALLRGGYC